MSVHLRTKKRKDGTLKGYYAEFYDATRQPSQVRRSLGTQDERTAVQKLAKIEREWARGDYDPWTDRIRREGTTATEALDEFIADRKRSGCAPATVDTYEAVLRPFVDSLGPAFPLYGIEERQVRRFIARPARQQDPNATEPPKPKSEATKRSYGARFRIFFSWCVEQKLLTSSPAPAPSAGKSGRRRDLPEFLTYPEFERLLTAIETHAELGSMDHGNRWLLDAARFAVGSGLRRGELCALRWGAVDLPGRMIHVRNADGFTTKSGHERAVPLVGEARAVAARLDAERRERGEPFDRRAFVLSGADGGPLNGSYASKRFRKYRRLAKLPEEISFHSLRHTFASWWVQRGGDLYRLKEVLGHADIKTTMKYAHLRPESLLEEAERLFGSEGIGHDQQGEPSKSARPRSIARRRSGRRRVLPSA